MAALRDTGWLYAFYDNESWFLMAGNGLIRAIDRLAKPNTQYPAIVLAVGKGTRCISEAFPHLPLTNLHALAHVHTDQTTIKNDRPVFIAVVDAQHAFSGHRPPDRHQTCHEATWVIGSHTTALHQLADVAFARLILPFTDVLCIFLDDFKSNDEAFDLLSRWASIACKYGNSWKPRVIFITRRTLTHPWQRHIECFEDAQCLKITDNQHRPLHKSISHSISIVQKFREDANMLFSASHLKSFSEAALKHVATSMENFDFVSATRIYNPIGVNFGMHLRTFLDMCLENQASEQFYLRHIASAMVMDSCPPGMHRFPASSVFDTLYYSPSLEACAVARSHDYAILELCKILRAKYCSMYSSDENGISAAKRHLRLVHSVEIDWAGFCTTNVCILCLRRKPEHAFFCGHSFCDMCIRIFGAGLNAVEYAYELAQCLLCQKPNRLVVYLKPPTAGTRLLVLDGGGIRGIFTLQAIKALDVLRDLPYPIYDEFDLALGTSSGGLIILTMFLRYTIAECMALFETLAKRVFAMNCPTSMMAKLCSFLASLVTDSLYGAGEMEACVKNVYGTSTLFFSGLGHASGRSGTKFGVTSMSVSSSKLCILSTYNGITERRKDCGYTHYRPLRTENEVLVRDAARATSAAPSYFPAKFINGLGFLQDGGAGKHNNPIDPAEWESKAIWNAAPDLVISIGTGYAQSPEASPVIQHRLRFRDRFVPRLLRLFGAMISAQGSWNDHLNRVGEDQRKRYFRINMSLDQEPELDNIAKLADLKQLSASYLEKLDFRSILQALFSASFFFELHRPPVRRRNSYYCVGSIRCRSPNSQALVARILQEYPAASFTTDEGVSYGHVDTHDICRGCGRYDKKIAFSVYHPDQAIAIYIRFSLLWKRSISGLPQNASTLVKAQILDAGFGRPDHQQIDYATSCRCDTSRKRKNIPTFRNMAKRRRLI